jgi:hypothetical protein
VIGEWRLIEEYFPQKTWPSECSSGMPDWDKRFRVLGKSLSTIRMSFRIANCLEGFKYFLSLKKRDLESNIIFFDDLYRTPSDPLDFKRRPRVSLNSE